MRKIFTLMLGITVMLASCSKDVNAPSGEKNTTTFTAKLDGYNKTRAVTDPTDEAITRAVLEIYNAQSEELIGRTLGVIDGDEITFTAELEDEILYSCLFWADGGEGTYDITDLKAVTRTSNASVAYYAQKLVQISRTPVEVTLSHAVAKVVLEETETLMGGAQVNIAFGYKNYSFNVADGSVTDMGDDTMSGNVTIENEDTTGQICSLYVFVPADGADPVTPVLSYRPYADPETKHVEITNVPLKRNYRTVLKGAFASIGQEFPQQFNVSLNKEWQDDQDIDW